MKYRKVGILLIIAFVSLITIPITLGSSSTEFVISVATDGSGDYNCDGLNDHIEINEALKYVANHPDIATVYLKSGTYIISDTVFIGSNTILEGDSDAIIKLVDNAQWPQHKSLIGCMGNPMESQTDVKTYNVTIRNFEIDGNFAGNSDYVSSIWSNWDDYTREEKEAMFTGRPKGGFYYNLITLVDVHNLNINDMYLHDNTNDLIKLVGSSSNISIFNNTARYQGHEFVYAVGAQYLNVYNNSVQIRINSGVRCYNSNHLKIYDNDIYTDRGGFVGIYILKYGGRVVDDVEIYNNTIHDLIYGGIYLEGYGSYSDPDTASNVYIHHNKIYDNSQGTNSNANGGITITGFNNTIIENNVIIGNKGDGIAIRQTPTNTNPSQVTGLQTFVRNNIIMNQIFLPQIPGSGYGINNYMPDDHKVIAEYNSVYGNVGTYTGGSITYSNNIENDPLFADISNHDFHLKSAAGRWSDNGWVFDTVTSPLIDAGHSTSDHSNEPGSNGNRINIGRYGNTAEASRSISDQPTASAGLDRTVNAGEIVTLDGSASTDDVGIVSYVWDFDDSDGLQQDATSAIVQYSYSAAGIYAATLTVTDGEGGKDSDTVTITVNSLNHAPVLNSIGAKSVEEESALSFIVSVSDADANTLVYSATDLPSGASIESSTGAFSWTPSDSQVGTHTVTFEVTDSQLTDSEEVTITVNGIPATAPSLVYDNRLRESSPDTTLAGNYYIDIGNNDGVVSYRDVMWFDLSAYNNTDTVSSATLSLYWYYPSNSPRNQDTVVEIYRPSDWNPGQVSWNNKAAGTPWNNAGGDWFDANNVAQGSEPYASITFDANDLPDDRYYEFDITELVQDYVSGEYDNTGLFLKAQNEYDNYIAFYSSDWSNEDQRPKLTITHTQDTEPVNNNAPVLNSIGSRTVEVGNSLSFMVSATDADDDILTYSAAGLPAGASFNSASGEFIWTPSEGQTGTYVVTSEVTDGYLADSEAFTITVNAAYPRWDVNKDGIVNILDITLVGQNIGTSAESGPRCDVNQDGLINILDLTVVGQNFGKTVN